MFPHGRGANDKEGRASSSSKSSSNTPLYNESLYRPSIYSFHCLGKYEVSTTKSSQREGTCHGFRSRLNLLADMDIGTKRRVLEDFTLWASAGDEVRDDGHGHRHPPSHDTHDSRLPDEAFAWDEATSELAMSSMLVHHDSIVEGGDMEEKPQRSSPNDRQQVVKEQDWSCYGSTNVDYLVLKDVNSGDETVQAVLPRNDGLLIRKIWAPPATRNVTDVRLGWLNVILKVSDDSIESSDADPAQLPETRAPLPEEVPPRPSSEALTDAKEATNQFLLFTRKVGEHCVMNSRMLYDNLSDDFPARMWASGARTLQRVPVTIEQTGASMSRLLARLLSSFDDDDFPPARKS